jgi:hypothetical protein
MMHLEGDVWLAVSLAEFGIPALARNRSLKTPLLLVCLIGKTLP